MSRDYEVDTEWGELHRLAGNKKTYRKKYASMKRCSSLLIIRETTAVKYHLTPVRMAIIKMSTNKICWRGCKAVKETRGKRQPQLPLRGNWVPLPLYGGTLECASRSGLVWWVCREVGDRERCQGRKGGKEKMLRPQ